MAGTNLVALTELKVVIRCRSFAASRTFYLDVLGLNVVEEWEEPGGAGCVFSLTHEGDGGALEIYEMATDNPRYDAAFASPLGSDKIDVQFRTPSVDAWAEALRGQWPFSGPEDLPWGHRWIKLRDPDNMLIAIYEDAPRPTQ